MPWFCTIHRFSSLTKVLRMAAAMSGWLKLPSVSPMSCSSAQTTYSSSRPSFSASVAVGREWVSRSTGKPPKSPSSRRRWSRMRSGNDRAIFMASGTMSCQSSLVLSSMRVNRARVWTGSFVAVSLANRSQMAQAALRGVLSRRAAPASTLRRCRAARRTDRPGWCRRRWRRTGLERCPESSLRELPHRSAFFVRCRAPGNPADA